jgi:hypothetical protein
MIRIYFLAFIFCISRIEAQSFHQAMVQAQINSEEQFNAFTGGLNNPQFWHADLNIDGIKDLIVFDREGNKILPFIHSNNTWLYAPKYAINFPEIQNWVVFYDYNKDGIEDFFTTNYDSLRVWKGYIDNDQLKFQLQIRDLLYQGNSGLLNIYISAVDIPAITDVDNDHDADILTFNIAGGYVEFFKNLSQENGYNNDSLIFIKQDRCWGKFYEGGLHLTNNLNITCPSLRDDEVLSNRHSGSTLLALDMDNDNDKELMLGDISFSNINMMYNGGTPTDAFITNQDTLFPSNTLPVNIYSFPAAFSIDADFDGINDLIVAPNARSLSINKNVVWFYKNVRTNENPKFEFQQNDYLVNKMIDFGTSAFPTVFDYNADGLMDIVVGNFGYQQGAGNFVSRIALLQNIGTAQSPKFALIDDNYLGLQSENFRSISPTFGDIDNDGDKDLIFGTDDGIIHFIPNVAGAGNTAVFGTRQSFYFNIDIGQVAAPQLFDIDNDSDLDLIIGERNGNVNFYRNNGNINSPNFTNTIDGITGENLPEDISIGNVNTTMVNYSTSFSHPYFYKENNVIKLLVGTELGGIWQYDNIEGNLATSFNKTTEKFENINEGFFTAPLAYDFDGDGLHELLVGNRRGGLAFYSRTLPTYNDVLSSINNNVKVEKFNVSIFPNPNNGTFNILFVEPNKYSIALYNSIGEIVHSYSNINQKIYKLDENKLSKGMYWLKIVNENNETIFRKIIIN